RRRRKRRADHVVGHARRHARENSPAAPQLLSGHHHGNDTGALRRRRRARPERSGHRRRFRFCAGVVMNPQLEGIEQIEGTYAFDIRTSNKALKLNRFLWNMIRADWRDRYKADPEGLMDEAGLSETEKELIRNEDWIGLVRN